MSETLTIQKQVILTIASKAGFEPNEYVTVCYAVPNAFKFIFNAFYRVLEETLEDCPCECVACANKLIF